MTYQNEEKLSLQTPQWLRDLWCPPVLRNKMQLPGLGVPVSSDLQKVLMDTVRVEAKEPKVLGCGRIGLKPVMIEGMVDDKGLVGEMILVRSKDEKIGENRIGFFIPNTKTKKLMLSTLDEALGMIDNELVNTVRWVNNGKREQDLREMSVSWIPSLGPLSVAAETIQNGNEVIFYTGKRAYLDSLVCMGIRPAKFYAGVMELLTVSRAWRLKVPVNTFESIPQLCLDKAAYEPVK